MKINKNAVKLFGAFLLLASFSVAEDLKEVNQKLAKYNFKAYDVKGKDFAPLAKVMFPLKEYAYTGDHTNLKKVLLSDQYDTVFSWNGEDGGAARFVLPVGKADRILLWKRYEKEEITVPGSEYWLRDYVYDLRKIFKEDAAGIELKKLESVVFSSDYRLYKYSFPKSGAIVSVFLGKKKPFPVYLEGIYLKNKSPYGGGVNISEMKDQSDPASGALLKILKGFDSFLKEGSENALSGILDGSKDATVLVSWKDDRPADRKYPKSEFIELMKANRAVMMETGRMLKEYRGGLSGANLVLVEDKTKKGRKLITAKFPSGATLVIAINKSGFLGMSESISLVSVTFGGYCPFL